MEGQKELQTGSVKQRKPQRIRDAVRATAVSSSMMAGSSPLMNVSTQRSEGESTAEPEDGNHNLKISPETCQGATGQTQLALHEGCRLSAEGKREALHSNPSLPHLGVPGLCI